MRERQDEETEARAQRVRAVACAEEEDMLRFSPCYAIIYACRARSDDIPDDALRYAPMLDKVTDSPAPARKTCAR